MPMRICSRMLSNSVPSLIRVRIIKILSMLDKQVLASVALGKTDKNLFFNADIRLTKEDNSIPYYSKLSTEEMMR